MAAKLKEELKEFTPKADQRFHQVETELVLQAMSALVATADGTGSGQRTRVQGAS